MWEVDTEAEPGTPDETTGKNNGGIIIYLARDSQEYIEMCRVRFIRRNSTNPRKGFRKALEEKLRDAQAAVDALNKIDTDLQDAENRLNDLLDRADAEREEILNKAKIEEPV